MRTRRQTELSEVCEGEASWAKIKLAKKGKKNKNKPKQNRKWRLFGGVKGKCNLIKHGWLSRQRAYRLSAAS